MSIVPRINPHGALNDDEKDKGVEGIMDNFSDINIAHCLNQEVYGFTF